MPEQNIKSQKGMKSHLQSLYEKYGTPPSQCDKDNKSRSRDRHLRQKSREEKRKIQSEQSKQNVKHKTIENCLSNLQISDADVICPAECPHLSLIHI